MQCRQPFFGTGFLNNLGSNYPCNYAFPQAQPPLCPEIIGEGEVASVVYPDGSIHLYFIPLDKRPFPYNCYHNQNCNSFCNNAIGAYYVRGISNPISPALFNQQCQKVWTTPSSRPCYMSDCNLSIPSPGFQLKFHNDRWTSTTDLQYFFPFIRRCDWFPGTQQKGCASVQVDIPVKDCTIDRQKVLRICSRSEENICSGCDSAAECPSTKHKHDSKKSNKWFNKNKKILKKESEQECRCKARTTDKAMVTVTDQSSGCTPERKTQTCRSAFPAANSCPGVSNRKSNEVKTELWIPSTSFSAKAMKRDSTEKIVGIYEKCSSTCTCSDTESNK